MKFHKNLHVVALFAAMFALNAQAAPVSSAQVVNAVSAWASANGSAFDGPGRAVSAEAVSENGTNLYWIVRMSKGGAVIASPDTDLDLVVAVLEKFDGSFPKGHPLPAILRRDMLNRLSVLGASPAASAASGIGLLSVSPQSRAESGNLPEDVKASVKAANAQWNKYSRVRGVSMLAESLEGGDSSPYVRRIVDGFEAGGRFTHWNQGDSPDGKPCYNYYVPYNEVCGCVATAGAAIMQFFGCVEDFGEVGSAADRACSIYGKDLSDRKTISGAIDWSILPKSMGGSSDKALDEEGRKLLGRVTHNIGTMVGMSWATSGPGGESGAYLLDLPKVFGAYAVVDGESGPLNAHHVSFSDTGSIAMQYFKMVYAQNWAGAPVALGISSDSGGHAVVACGYAKDADGDEFCRVFMGWGGYGDAWYVFPDVASYNIVNDAVTMISYDCTGSMGVDDVLNLDQAGANRMFNMAGDVPVCGRANVTNTVLTLPGVTKSAGEGEMSVSFTLTVNVDSNGYFAVRIPRDTKDLTLRHDESGASVLIAPFDAKVLANAHVATCAQLCDALPDELMFMVLGMTQCTSVEAARAIALRDGKALLMISGDSGSARTACLLDGITELDSTTDLSNRFVMVFTPVSSASINGVDGNPSVGVFDPAEGSADLRWWEWNGRLSYTNFVDYVDDDSGEVVYTIDGSDPEAAMSALSNSDGTGVLDIGYDTFLRRRADAVVTVTGIDLSSGDVLETGTVSPAYGEVAKAWTNCEEVVFSAPSVYTNESEGVIYACAGWTTNEVYGADGVARFNPTNTVSINIAAGEHVAFTWVWTPAYFRVRTIASGLPVLPGVSAVYPAEMWAEAFSRATVSAENAFGVYGRKEWVMRRPTVENGDYKTYYDGFDAMDALVMENGNTLSFFVFEPVDVCVNYVSGYVPSNAQVEKYTLAISADPAEIMETIPLRNGYVWGTNTVIDPVAYFAPALQSYTDATGGVWVCTGWEASGIVVDGSEAIWELSSTEKVYEAKCLWTLVPPADDSEEDEENGEPGNPDQPGPDVPGPDVPGPDVPDVPDEPVPAPIAFSSVSCEAGVWTVVLTNGVKGCWYHLYATNELSAASADWPYAETEEANPQQATADGPVTFRATGSGNAMFWRAKATAKETGD